MTSPGPLFDAPPRTHRGDPQTSRDAEAKIRRSGTMGRHARTVLALLHHHGRQRGATASELARHAAGRDGFDADETKRLLQVRRRLSDLRVMGRAAIRGRRGDESIYWPED